MLLCSVCSPIKCLTNIKLYYNIKGMIKIIENVLKEYSDMQLNLESKAAREFLAKKINSALLAEIRKQKSETFVTDAMYDASIDAYHKND